MNITYKYAYIINLLYPFIFMIFHYLKYLFIISILYTISRWLLLVLIQFWMLNNFAFIDILLKQFSNLVF